MPVVFELYMFKPELIEEIKRKEIKINPSARKAFIPELGGLFCLNTARQIAFRFFSVEEALDLINTGYEVALESGTTEPQRLDRLEDFPAGMVEEGVVELAGEYNGVFTWGDSKQEFRSRDELKSLIQQHTLVEEKS